MNAAQEILAEDIMRQPVVCTSPNTSLEDLERLLVESHITGVPVVEHGQLIGVISRSDVVRVQVLVEALDGQVSDRLQETFGDDGFNHPLRETFHGFRQRLADLKVRDAMRTQVISSSRRTPIGQLATDMIRHHVHRVIVVDQGKPVGIVSSLDLVKLIAAGRYVPVASQE